MRMIGPAVTFIILAAFPQITRSQLTLLGSDVTSDNLYSIDPVNGGLILRGHLGDDVVASLTFDPIHQILYGSSTLTDSLLRIDPSNGATTVIGSFGGVQLMHAIQYNPNNNTLYGGDDASRKLYRIDVTTGSATAVAPIGIDINDMAFDPVNNIMYATPNDPVKKLYTINLTTGETITVGDFNNAEVQQITGLAYDPVLGLYGSDNGAGLPSTSFDQLFKIDTTTGQATLVGNLQPGNFLGLTFIPEPTTSLMCALTGSICLTHHRRSRKEKRSY